MRFHYLSGFRCGPTAVVLLAIGLAGCGGSGQPSLTEVKGKVLYGDQPLKATGLGQAIVQFHQLAEGGTLAHKSYQGKFDDDGNYSVKAPPGRYKVVVIATKKQPEKKANGEINYDPPEPAIPRLYSNPNDTKLEVNVEADTPAKTHDLKLIREES